MDKLPINPSQYELLKYYLEKTTQDSIDNHNRLIRLLKQTISSHETLTYVLGWLGLEAGLLAILTIWLIHKTK